MKKQTAATASALIDLFGVHNGCWVGIVSQSDIEYHLITDTMHIPDAKKQSISDMLFTANYLLHN